MMIVMMMISFSFSVRSKDQVLQSIIMNFKHFNLIQILKMISNIDPLLFSGNETRIVIKVATFDRAEKEHA